MIESLGDSRYLMTAYAAASDRWQDFRGTGDQNALSDVAGILCGAWTVLSEDDDFLAAMTEMSDESMPDDVASALGKHTVHGDRRGGTKARPVSALPEGRESFLAEISAHRQTDKLLARETTILIRAGMSPAHAVRLVSDLAEMLGPTVAPIPHGRVTNFQIQAAFLAEELCKARQVLQVFDYGSSESFAKTEPHRRWVRTLRVAGLALKATAGAGGAVGNVAAAIASFGALTGFGLVSVLAGAEVMTAALEQAIQRDDV